MANGEDFGGRYPHILFRKHWEIRPETNYLLGKCDAMVAAISGMPLQPAYHERLLDVSLVKGAQATTAIEGNTLTEDEVRRVAEGASLAVSKQYQEREVRNILEAMNNILVDVADDGIAPLITEDLVKSFHVAVGRELGEHFDAIPGQYRTDQRIVGPYRCPRPEDVPDLMARLCSWLRNEFGFASGRQTFADAVVQAIVTHVYLEWIHPFGDGNGRTGRLLEFYILLRAGNPDIASHILSNFYNLTRGEYYRHLERANRERDVTAFIAYAVQGYHDGLVETLSAVRENALEVAWKHLVYTRFADRGYRKKTVHKRRRELVLAMRPGQILTPNEIAMATPDLARHYAAASVRTLLRDLDELEAMELVVETDGKYRINLGLLGLQLARRRRPSNAA
jgi:cell filamentation protein, protein adenylyltransferase